MGVSAVQQCHGEQMHLGWLLQSHMQYGSTWCLAAARYILHVHVPIAKEALGCLCKWYLGRSPLLRMGHHGERKDHSACRFRPNLQYYLVALGVALQQDTSFICKYQLIPEALGCQCKP